MVSVGFVIVVVVVVSAFLTSFACGGSVTTFVVAGVGASAFTSGMLEFWFVTLLVAGCACDDDEVLLVVTGNDAEGVGFGAVAGAGIDGVAVTGAATAAGTATTTEALFSALFVGIAAVVVVVAMGGVVVELEVAVCASWCFSAICCLTFRTSFRPCILLCSSS